MSPKRTTTKKLTDLEKQEIVALYRQGGETTASLASRFGTSGSTINRLLKSSIPETEYELLIQQKRGQKGSEVEVIPTSDEISPPPLEATTPVVPVVPEIRYGKTVTVDSDDKPRITRRRRSSATSDRSPEIAAESTPTPAHAQRIFDRQLPIEIVEDTELTNDESLSESEEEPEDVTALAAMFGEEITIDDDDFGDDEEDLEDEEEEIPTTSQTTSDRFLTVEDSYTLSILPLSQAILPRSCYITVDKFAELVIRPLKDFAELGRIPQAEVQQRTLPIFDNQRVAKRFANHRSQKTIKIPDSRVLHKTAPHLKAKGITRLLIDGKIYSID